MSPTVSVTVTDRGGHTASASAAYTVGSAPSRMLIGAAVGGNSDPSYLEREAGRPLDLRRTYFGATSAEATKGVNTARADVAAGRTPFVSFKVPHTWADMAEGRGDTWARGVLTSLGTVGGPVRACFHHEPENDEDDDLPSVDPIDTDDILEWKAMQERFLTFPRSSAVKLDVCMTGWHAFNEKPEFGFSRVVPVGIDALWVDVYQRYGTTDAGLNWTPIDNYFGQVDAFAKSRGIPWGLAETGVTDEAMGERPNAEAQLIEQARAHDCFAFCHFDSDLNSKGSWRLDGTSTVRRNKRAQFIAALQA